jgi:hypothetical protein
MSTVNACTRRVTRLTCSPTMSNGSLDRPSDRPFLVYLAHKTIHPNVIQRDDGSVVPIPGQPGGFVAADPHRGRYVGRTMPRRASAFKPPLGKPALLRQIDKLPPLGPKTATSDDEIRGRPEMLLRVDDSLGRILAALERKEMLNDTMVVSMALSVDIAPTLPTSGAPRGSAAG